MLTLTRRPLLGLPLLLLVPLLFVPPAARADALTVFAAASLTDAMQDASALWVHDGHAAPLLSFASSSTLARQIDQGAPADLFASADERWMDDVQKHGMIAAGTRRDLLGNALVLVMPAAQVKHVDIRPGFDLAALLGPNGRLAVGDPAHVPAGIYAAAGAEDGSASGRVSRSTWRRRRTCGRRCCWSSAARRRPASSMRPTRRWRPMSRSPAPSPPTAIRRSCIRSR